jgi:hypothetical protein
VGVNGRVYVERVEKVEKVEKVKTMAVNSKNMTLLACHEGKMQ